jgi:hypothetical protein
VDEALFGWFMIEYAEAHLVHGWETVVRLHEWLFDGYFFFSQVFFNYSFSFFGYWRFRVLATAEFALAANVETAVFLSLFIRQDFLLLRF